MNLYKYLIEITLRDKKKCKSKKCTSDNLVTSHRMQRREVKHVAVSHMTSF